MSSSLPFTLSTASLAESGYPDKDSFDSDQLEKLLDLPDGGRINLEWLQQRVWREATSFQVICL
jgi:hypothetical protein